MDCDFVAHPAGCCSCLVDRLPAPCIVLQDMVEMQDYLACTINSVSGRGGLRHPHGVGSACLHATTA